MVMDEEPLAGVFEFVDRAYVRLQAAAVLTHCLEENDTASIQYLVEDLVFVGPHSLTALREIKAEVASRRSEIGDDKLQIFAKLVDELTSFGVHLSGKYISLSLTRLTGAGFVALLVEHGVSDEMKQLECLRIFEEYLDILGGMDRHLSLLGEIEIYLQDWLWGLIYQSTHQEGMVDSDIKRVQWLL
jgi:hypothetical protein